MTNDNDATLALSVNGDELLQSLGRAWGRFKAAGGERMTKDDFAAFAMDAFSDPKLAHFITMGEAE